MIATKIYTTINLENKDSSSQDINKYFESFIDQNIPVIYENFKRKYENHQTIKNSEISINEYLVLIKDEKIVNN